MPVRDPRGGLGRIWTLHGGGQRGEGRVNVDGAFVPGDQGNGQAPKQKRESWFGGRSVEFEMTKGLRLSSGQLKLGLELERSELVA